MSVHSGHGGEFDLHGVAGAAGTFYADKGTFSLTDDGVELIADHATTLTFQSALDLPPGNPAITAPSTITGNPVSGHDLSHGIAVTPMSIASDVHFTQPLDITGYLEVPAGVTVTGDQAVRSLAVVSGNLISTIGHLTVDGELDAGSLNIGQNATLDGSGAVSAPVTVDGALAGPPTLGSTLTLTSGAALDSAWGQAAYTVGSADVAGTYYFTGPPDSTPGTSQPVLHTISGVTFTAGPQQDAIPTSPRHYVPEVLSDDVVARAHDASSSLAVVQSNTAPDGSADLSFTVSGAASEAGPTGGVSVEVRGTQIGHARR